MYNSILGASSEPPRSLLVNFRSSAKNAPGCSQEHFFAQAASMQPVLALLVTFHSSAKSAPGCSQEHYSSTWPPQSTTWALIESSSKFLASSWGFLRCLKITLKQRVWSTWPSRGSPWTPWWSLTRPMCPQVAPPGWPKRPQMGPNLPQVAPRSVPMTPK